MITFALDPKSGVPIYRQIQDQIRYGIASGLLEAGEQLPTVRALAVEIAWSWLRFQPDSDLSRWYQQRFGSGGKRLRRIGIVAMARRLMIDLWRYIEKGIMPAGAVLKRAAGQ